MVGLREYATYSVIHFYVTDYESFSDNEHGGPLPVAVGDFILNFALLAIAISTGARVVRYRGTTARLVTLLTGGVEVAYCLLVSRLADTAGTTDGVFWARLLLILAAPAVLGAHLFALSLGRADPAGSIRRHRIALLFQTALLGGFLLLIGSPGFVTGFEFQDGSHAVLLGPIGRLYLGLLLFGIVLVGFRLESTLRGTEPRHRRQLRWAALGVFGVVGYFVYLLTEGIVLGQLGRDALAASVAPLGIAASLVGWTHIRGQLSDAGVIVGRHVVYRSLTGVFVAVYIGLVLAFGYLAETLGIRPGFVAAATILFGTSTALAAFLLSGTFRRRLSRFVEKNVYSSRLDYRSWWLRASHELVSGVGVPELIARATRILEELFGSRPVVVYLARRAGDPFRPMGPGAEAAPEIGTGEPVLALLAAAGEPIRIPDRRDRNAEPELLPILVEHEDLIEATRARVLAPLRTAERLVGFVALGPRADGTDYGYEDRALLETITLQLAGAVRGAWLSEELGAAREMEVFSQWAGVVVHDLKNFVSPLKLFVSNARRHLHNPEYREQAIDDIQSVVQKMEVEIGRLTALRHGEDMAFGSVDLEWVLDSVLSRSGVQAREGWNVQKRYAGLPAVTGDAALLDRVFTNLVTNALEAMPDGGLLSIETEDIREEGGGRRAVIRFRDTGTGMSPAFLQHRLFQPFATTKKKGWGLGLYQCRSIVEAHGGALTASSQPGLGTEFRLSLPLKVAAVRDPVRDDHRRPSARAWRHPDDRT
jgi:putative PEP-CTERM system histidine kinase